MINADPLISVVILNYNGAPWLERCLGSLREQTIFSSIEIIVADNLSPDGSAKLAEQLVQGWPNAQVIQHGANLGYCEGNNRAALSARGRYLFFLNNDTWLERDCLENLLSEVKRFDAQAASPQVLNYDDDSLQPVWGLGFDVFGLPSFCFRFVSSREIFMPPGCSLLIERDLFLSLGEFDREIFMYADETDLAWRVWISGHKIIGAATARVHHRLSANVNPHGGEKMLELRTSDSKRYFTNRNLLLVLAKNGQHVLLLLLIPMQLALLLCEAVVGLVLIRRWSFIRRAYGEAVRDWWRLRPHIHRERGRIRSFRRRSDWQMLRFLKARLNRWDELHRIRKFGLPKVTPR